MIITVKLLRQNNQVFAPLTIAEAVLVNTDTKVITLDEALDKKIENIHNAENKDLNIVKLGVNVVIEHSNLIQGTDIISPKLFSVDNNGHIKNIIPVNPLEVNVGNDNIYYDGSLRITLQLGDDFTINNNILTLRWNNL